MPVREVLSISSLRLDLLRTSLLDLAIHVEGEADTPGWNAFALHHHIYVRPPLDGIYEAEMVGVRPDAPPSRMPVKFTFDATWAGFPIQHLLGLRVHSATNSLTVALA
jgi:hypothetical protein